MKWKWVIIIATVLLILLFLIWLVLGFGLIQKPSMSLMVNGKPVAIVKQPFFGPIQNNCSADIYVGSKKIFSLREDFWDGPTFIYPFADGKRFLCDYDDDVISLDFVVDFGFADANHLIPSEWPSREQLRADFMRGATNVVFDTKAVVRLPNYEELQEVSMYLDGSSTVPINAGYFNVVNPVTKKSLLLDLATNRDSIWPTK